MTSSITIRELDSTAPETVELLLPIVRAAFAADLNGFPEPDAGWLASHIDRRADHVSTVFAAFDDHGVPAAFASVGHDTETNRTLAYGPLSSDPARRGRGFAGALLPRLKDWARDQGCDRLVLDAPETAAALPFAEKRGGRLVGTEKRSTLDLRKIDRAQYEEWAAPSAGNAGYRSVRWTSRVPEDLAASYVRSRNAMDDAPHGELELEAKGLTVEEQRERERSALAKGLTTHVLAALAPDGSVAGYTQTMVFPGTGFRHAGIGDTAVVATHRGHGLGLRLKAENALWILDNVPHVDGIDTWNDEENLPMLRVNRRLGYEVADRWQAFQFEL